MSNNMRSRLAVSVAVAVLISAGIMSTEQVAAKWSAISRPQNKEIASATNGPDKAVGAAASGAETTVRTAVLVGQDGSRQPVEVVTEGAATPIVVPEDKAEAERLQQEVDQGHEAWRLDPVQVVQAAAPELGFTREDTYEALPLKEAGKHGVLVKHNGKTFLVELSQPAGPAANHIWQISTIREVRVITQTKKPDVGPGVEGLDYSKVIRWQQAVDAGRDLWRLDPLEVARREGVSYGFSAEDTFTLQRRLETSPIARHGEADILVSHHGKDYLMILVRPCGSDDGAIWTTLRVEPAGSGKPVPQQGGKVLFATNKFADWQWYKETYPQDMSFALLTGDKLSDRKINMPSDVLAKAAGTDFSAKVAIVAYLGETGPAQKIGIEQVALQGNTLTVRVHTKSARPGDMEAMMLTHPSDYVVIDRAAVDIWGGVKVIFIDQTGRVLDRQHLTINHHR